MFAEILSDQLA